MKICIIDYGVGNIRSVSSALQVLGIEAIITSDPALVAKANGIILPGVGAFKAGMQNLQDLNLLEVLREKVLVEKTPFLGICLGMQLLAEKSEENGLYKGLGFIPGVVKRIPVEADVKIPHIGWNEVRFSFRKTSLWENLEPRSSFYFVHSFYLDTDLVLISSYTDYGIPLTASIERENIFGVQFHPEKSQQAGLLLLKNFLDYVYTYEYSQTQAYSMSIVE